MVTVTLLWSVIEAYSPVPVLMSWTRVTSGSVVASSSSPGVTFTVCTVPQFSDP